MRADSRAQRPVGSPAKPSGARGRLRAAGIAWVRAPAEQPGQRRHGPRACGGASAAPGRRHLPRLSAEGSWRAAPATPGRARRRPGQRWARTSGRCRPLNCSAPRISSPCTLSFRARGTLFTILASLKSNQKIQKVCKGPPSPPLLVFARLLLWGTPTPPEERAHPSAASLALRWSLGPLTGDRELKQPSSHSGCGIPSQEQPANREATRSRWKVVPL